MPGKKPQERHRNGNAGQAGASFREYNVAYTLRLAPRQTPRH
jgi:hypothetical protein